MNYLFRIEFHSSKIIIEEVTSTRIKRRMLQQSRTVAESNSPKNEMFIRANTVPKEKSYAGAVMSRKTKNGTTK